MKPIFEKIKTPEDQSFYMEEVSKPYFTDQLHFHPEIEILYVREGTGTKYIGDSISSFCPGDIVIIGSETPHVWASDSDYMRVEGSIMSRAICIQFMNDFLGKSLRDFPELNKIREFLEKAKWGIQFSNKTDFMLIKLIEELPTLNGVNRLLRFINILELMSESKDIKYLSSQNYKPMKINSEDMERLEIIYQHVIQNYKNRITLNEIASKVNLTPHSFCRYFKSKTDMVFSYFVNEVRISNSCKLIMENKKPISQICFESGFNYLSNFNRQFKKIKGMTPSQYQYKFLNQSFDLMFDKVSS